MFMNIILWILYMVDYFLDKMKILIIFINFFLDDDNKLIVKEGEMIGFFICILDCNFVCDICWKLKILGGLSDFFLEDGMLLFLVVKRNMKMLWCIVEWRYNNEIIIEDNVFNI